MASKTSRTTTNSIGQTRRYHRQYLIAVSNPLRRDILRALKKGTADKEKLQQATGLDEAILEWHLSILEYGFCIERTSKEDKLVYRLTQEGRVVDHLE